MTDARPHGQQAPRPPRAPTALDSEPRSRRVRAYNLRVGDVLSFYDVKKHVERRMVIASVNLRERPRQPGTVVLTLTMEGARRKQRYIQWLEWHSLIRIRRAPP